MSLAPYLLYAGARPALRRLLQGGERIGLIDAHYFYPDGVAAVMLGRRFGLPVTVTARGSDISPGDPYDIGGIAADRVQDQDNGVEERRLFEQVRVIVRFRSEEHTSELQS